MGSEDGKFGGGVGREQEESQQGLAPTVGMRREEDHGIPLRTSAWAAGRWAGTGCFFCLPNPWDETLC